MNSTNKTKTSLAKFEEFFSTIYKDDVFEILNFSQQFTRMMYLKF